MVALPTINDQTYKLLLPSDYDQGGRIVDFNGPRILNAIPPRAAPGTIVHAPLADFKVIPRNLWDDIIARKDRDHSWIEDLVRDKRYGIPCTDQNGLGYCHAYGTVKKAMVKRLLQGHPFVMLSAESVGGPITRWTNQGADPADDMEQIAKFGACPQSFMDREHSLNHRNWKTGWEQEALNYRIPDWIDARLIRKNYFDVAATMCFLNIPGALGYMWWSHYISGPYRVLKLSNGRYALRNRNNWGPSFGDDGFLDMEEGKGTPDWLFGCLASIPYDKVYAEWLHSTATLAV